VPFVRDPQVAVEETLAEPTISSVGTAGIVPTLAITVTYEAVFNQADRKLPPIGFGFRERIVVKGTKVRLSFQFLPVTPGSAPQTIAREETFLVEKELITDDLGMFGSIPIQCLITISPEPDPRDERLSNTVTLRGLSVDSSVSNAPTVLTRLLSWVERLITRREP
jgi:hypothetical protein